MEELRDIGVPWYCDDCGEKVFRFYKSEDKEELKEYEGSQC
jgi:hypothetical protein